MNKSLKFIAVSLAVGALTHVATAGEPKMTKQQIPSGPTQMSPAGATMCAPSPSISVAPPQMPPMAPPPSDIMMQQTLKSMTKGSDTQLLPIQQFLSGPASLDAQFKMLKLDHDQEVIIESIVTESVPKLQAVFERNLTLLGNDLKAYLSSLKSEIVPVLTPQQQEVLSKIEGVQNAKLELIKAQVELDLAAKQNGVK